jgi:hypothetical protein
MSTWLRKILRNGTANASIFYWPPAPLFTCRPYG